MIPAIIVTVVGAVGMFFVKSSFAMVGVMIFGTIMMTGYMIGMAVLGAKIRDYTPEKEVGLFQGVRMVFLVLIPMVTGPYIGRGVSYIHGETYQDTYGRTIIKPNEFIFLFAGIVIILAIIPVIFIIRKERELKNNNSQIEQTAD